jgi:transposase
MEIAAMSGATRPSVDKWLARYERFGLEGLVSMTSPGGPRQIRTTVWYSHAEADPMWHVQVGEGS